MISLDIREYTEYDEFVREWYADELKDHGVSLDRAREQGFLNEDETRMLWALLGQLDEDELLVQLPEWLAKQKVGYVDGATPIEFVGRIDQETDKAILLKESASARPLMKLAHRIHRLEQSSSDADRANWLKERLSDHRRAFEQREDAVTLQEEWLPKSQVLQAVRRRA